MKNTNVIFADVLAALSDVNENGEVTSFNYEGLKELITNLQDKKKELADLAKEQKKAVKAEENAALAEAGKAYYDALPNGAEFQYKDSRDVIHTVTKIETKSKSGLSAACLISEAELLPGKTKRERYPKFYQIIIPTQE